MSLTDDWPLPRGAKSRSEPTGEPHAGDATGDTKSTAMHAKHTLQVFVPRAEIGASSRADTFRPPRCPCSGINAEAII